MRVIPLVLLCALAPAVHAAPDIASEDGTPLTCARPADPARDGQRDFDFEIGEWETQLRVLENPLSGSTSWLEYEGTSSVREVLDGRANLIELRVEGPSGRIEGLALRLYEPKSRQWSLNFSNIRSGVLTTPVIGAFADGCGEFYGQDTVDGRTILVRFVIKPLSPDTARFEQAYSADGGRTWEVNWIAIDTRIEAVAPPATGAGLPAGLREAVDAYDRATLGNDVTALSALIADDYLLVNSDSTVQDKPSYLEDFKVPGFKLEPYAMEQPLARAWGDAALTGGLLQLSWTLSGEQHSRLLRIAHVWVRQRGRWQIAYTQLTRVPESS